MTVETALILCGELEQPFDAYQHIACLSPTRKLRLSQLGIHAVCLFDYSLSEIEGEWLDDDIQTRLEFCLHQEREINSALRWAPLAYQHVSWRLKRYICLKKCIAAFLDTTVAEKLYVSSRQDPELVKAVIELTSLRSIIVEFGNGPKDSVGSIGYCIEPGFLPKAIDSYIVFALYACWLRLRLGINKILQEGVALVPTKNSLLRSMNCRRWIGLLQATVNRLTRKSAAGLTSIIVSIPQTSSVILVSEAWRTCFEADEVAMANDVVAYFTTKFPAVKVDQIVDRLGKLLCLLKPKAVLLAHDQSDYSRLLCFVGKKCGFPMIYLPHGLIFEDYSSHAGSSEFVPAAVLAWSDGSARAFNKKRGWETEVIGHHRYQMQINPHRELKQGWLGIKVLVLMSEWIAITAAGREDCSAHDLVEVAECLRNFGIQGNSVTLKFHYGVPQTDREKHTVIQEYCDITGYDCKVAAPDLDSLSLIGDHDLVITMLTSGIFEAVMLGTPVIVFGSSLNRVGSLAGYGIPFAKNQVELQAAIETYDNYKMTQAYAGIAQQLQSNSDVEMATLRLADQVIGVSGRA